VEAARENPFNTDAFLWFDAGHLCNNPDRMTADKMDKFNAFFDKTLITYVDVVFVVRMVLNALAVAVAVVVVVAAVPLCC
jgi:hypothetical protein